MARRDTGHADYPTDHTPQEGPTTMTTSATSTTTITSTASTSPPSPTASAACSGAVEVLRIEHHDAEGTVVDGTSRGDASVEVLKAHGWRWSRHLGMWYVPRSVGRPPKRALIEATAQALRAAGYGVEVVVDAMPGDPRVREDHSAALAAARVQRLEQRAARERSAAQARRSQAEWVVSRWPLGQPILAGHHSQARHERDLGRAHEAMGKAIEHQERAEVAERGARVAAGRMAARYAPPVVARRVAALEAAVRKQERTLAGMASAAGCDPAVAEGPGWASRRERLAHDRADLEFWRSVRERQVATGEAVEYGPQVVSPGDLVQVRGQWYSVVRANAKSVRVTTPQGPRTAPWHAVSEHRGRERSQE